MSKKKIVAREIDGKIYFFEVIPIDPKSTEARVLQKLGKKRPVKLVPVGEINFI